MRHKLIIYTLVFVISQKGDPEIKLSVVNVAQTVHTLGNGAFTSPMTWSPAVHTSSLTDIASDHGWLERTSQFTNFLVAFLRIYFTHSPSCVVSKRDAVKQTQCCSYELHWKSLSMVLKLPPLTMTC